MTAWSPAEHGLVEPRHDDRARATSAEWRALFDAHFEGCHRLIRRSGVLPADAEDLTQRVFLIAHEKLAAGEQLEHPGAWVRRIAFNVVREHVRWRRARLSLARFLEWTPGAAPTPNQAPDAQAAQHQTQRLVELTLLTMSTKLREVLVLAEFEGLRPQEIAEELAIPANTVRSRHRLAIEQFRRRWLESTREVAGEG